MDIAKRAAFYREEIPGCRIVLTVLHPSSKILLDEIQGDDLKALTP